MAHLPYEAVGFTTPGPPPSGLLPVSPARLIWAAMTVGTSPVGLIPGRRSSAELVWRTAMVAASLRESGSRWVRTAGYRRLDPSEKSAVSYFLGMTQAKVTCELLLGVSHLVHLDAMSALTGIRPATRSRPDFIGIDRATMTFTMPVEAKGLSGRFRQGVAEKAKTQAGLLPQVYATTTQMAVASVAYFASNRWQAHIVDPPARRDTPDPRNSKAAVLVAYYRPFMRALLEDARNADFPDDDVEPRIRLALPDVDVRVALPLEIYSLMAEATDADVWTPAIIETVGSGLLEVLTNPRSERRGELRPPPGGGRIYTDTANPLRCSGSDGLTVELGPTWQAPGADGMRALNRASDRPDLQA